MENAFRRPIFLLCVLGCLLGGCGNENPIASRTQEETQRNSKILIKTRTAKAILTPTKGGNVRGVVTFTHVSEGIRIVADIEGLSPGMHGFHIHEKGDCSTPDASSAGGHFDPRHSKHGSPDSPERHVGDLGNIVADSKGHAHYDRVDTLISFEGENNILGKAVIVHSDADDYKTQPTGNAGGREACGVIVFTD